MTLVRVEDRDAIFDVTWDVVQKESGGGAGQVRERRSWDGAPTDWGSGGLYASAGNMVFSTAPVASGRIGSSIIDLLPPGLTCEDLHDSSSFQEELEYEVDSGEGQWDHVVTFNVIHLAEREGRNLRLRARLYESNGESEESFDAETTIVDYFPEQQSPEQTPTETRPEVTPDAWDFAMVAERNGRNIKEAADNAVLPVLANSLYILIGDHDEAYVNALHIDQIPQPSDEVARTIEEVTGQATVKGTVTKKRSVFSAGSLLFSANLAYFRDALVEHVGQFSDKEVRFEG